MSEEGIGAPRTWLRTRPWGRDVARLAEGRVDDAILSVAEKMRQNTDDPASVPDMAGLVAFASLRPAEVQGASLVREMAMASILHSWLLHGGETFKFGRILTDELLHTDIDDVLCGEISVPYPTFYVTFAPEKAEADAPHGMMVRMNEETDRRTLQILPMYEPIPDIDQDVDTSLGIHVEMVPDRPFAGQLEDAVRYSTEVAAGDVLEMGDRPAIRIVMSDAAIKIRQYRSLQPLIPLVVNGLLYIDQCRSEIASGWPDAAPAGDVLKARSEGAGRRKAEQRLRARGWTPIRICEVNLADPDTAEHPGSGRTVEAHWRRGHWRRQAHGSGRSLTRRIRIRPTRIKGYAVSTDTPKQTRDYVVMAPLTRTDSKKEDR